MRATLTLDDDVAANLERLRKAREQSFEDLVSAAPRRGLKEMAARPKRRELFRATATDLGSCRIGGIDNIAEAIAIAEGESFS